MRIYIQNVYIYVYTRICNIYNLHIWLEKCLINALEFLIFFKFMLISYGYNSSFFKLLIYKNVHFIISKKEDCPN